MVMLSIAEISIRRSNIHQICSNFSICISKQNLAWQESVCFAVAKLQLSSLPRCFVTNTSRCAFIVWSKYSWQSSVVCKFLYRLWGQNERCKSANCCSFLPLPSLTPLQTFCPLCNRIFIHLSSLLSEGKVKYDRSFRL